MDKSWSGEKKDFQPDSKLLSLSSRVRPGRPDRHELEFIMEVQCKPLDVRGASVYAVYGAEA
jgi:hypothetical protein